MQARRTGLGAQRVARLQLARDQRGVAVDVRADLQDRRLAVAAGQGRQVRFRHDHRHLHRQPVEVFQSEDETDLLRERGGIMVMKDQFSHAISRRKPDPALQPEACKKASRPVFFVNSRRYYRARNAVATEDRPWPRSLNTRRR